MDSRKEAGKAGEEAAASYLEKRGVRILVRNFRTRFGEIDVIGTKQNVLLVVEVKQRSGENQGTPGEAVDGKKQKRICRAFDYYRMKHQINDYVPVRFDVVEVDKHYCCRWIKNAFDYQE